MPKKTTKQTLKTLRPAQPQAEPQRPESIEAMQKRAEESGRYLVAAFRLAPDGTVILEWMSRDFRHRDYRLAVGLLRDELARELRSLATEVQGESANVGDEILPAGAQG